MSPAQNFETLVTSVRKSVELLEQIKELFVVHEKAMRERDLDAVEDANQGMANLMMQLKENFRERIDLQTSLVPNLNTQTWASFMQSLPSDNRQQLESLWQQLDSQLADVQQKSLVNQQIVRRGQQQVDHLVNILQGKGSLDKIYDNRGSSGHVNSQSTIGKA